MENLKFKYRTYTREAKKDTLLFREYKLVNDLDENNISVIVKSDDITIANRVYKSNPKNNEPKEIANIIYEKLNNEQATEYHVISVFITVNKEIFPYKFVTKVDKPEIIIKEIVDKTMFVFNPKVKESKLKDNKNFLDFSILKGDNIICRRFSYINDDILDFNDAFKTIESDLNEEVDGRYYHDIKIVYNVSNKVTGLNYTQEFAKSFNSNYKKINVKDGIKKMLKSF